MVYRLTIDRMSGGVTEREPEIQEYVSLRTALEVFDNFVQSPTAPLSAPYELTLYRREDGSLNMTMLRRLSVWEAV